MRLLCLQLLWELGNASSLETLLRALGPHASLLETLDRSRLTSSDSRRRTVSDVDCDNVEATVDSIEQQCADLRYKVFMQEYPLVMQTADQDDNELTERVTFNNTMAGDPLGFDGDGIRKIFTNQRTMLYGPNGTCTDPKPNYLATNADLYANTLFGINRDVNAVYDTEWSNLDIVNAVVGAGVQNTTNVFVAQADGLLTAMNDAIAAIGANELAGNLGYTNTTVQLLTNLSLMSNGLQALLDSFTDTATSSAADAQTAEAASTAALLAQLDTIADLFSTSDTNVANVIDAMGGQLAPILGTNPGTIASDQVQLVTTKAAALVADNSQTATGNINDTTTDWTRAFQVQLSDSWNALQTHSDYLAKASDTIDASFNTTQAKFDQQLNDTLNSIRALVLSAQNSSTDAKSLVEQMNAQLTNTKASLDTVYASLANDNSAAAIQLKKQIAALLSSSTTASAAQLQSVIDSLSGLGVNLSSLQNGSGSKLGAAIANIQQQIATAGAGNANTGSGAQSVLNAQSGLSQQLVSSTSDYQSTLLGGTMGNMLDEAGNQATDIYSTATSFDSDSQNAKGDMQTALSAATGTASDQAAAQALAVTQDKNYVLSLVSGNATAVSSASSSSGNSLSAVSDNLAWILSQSTQASTAQAGLATASSASSAQVADSVGDLDDSLASGYSGSAKLAVANLGDSVDSASTSVSSSLNKQASALGDQIQTVVTNVDQSPTSSPLVADDSLDDLGATLSQTVGGSSAAGLGSNSTLSSGLSGVYASAFSQAGAVATSLTKGSGSVEADTRTNAANAVSSASAQYSDSIRSIAQRGNAAGRTATLVDPKVAQSLGSLNQGTDQVRTRLSAGQAELDELTQSLVKGGAANPDLKPFKQLMWDIMRSVGTNMTALARQSASSDLPSNFPSGLEDVLTNILNSEYAAANVVANGTAQLAGSVADTDGSTSGSGVLDDMDASTSAWSDSFQQNQQSAYSQGQARVDGLAYLSDSASSVANLAAALGTSGNSVGTAGNRGIASSSLDLQAMVSSLYSSVSAANSTLARQSGGASANAAFGSQVASNKANAFMKALDNESLLAGTTSGDTGDALSQATGRQAMNLNQLQATLTSDQQRRQANLAAGLASMSDQDAGFAKNISGNRDAVAVNLLMSKRAVRDLLNAWSGYADYETGKFRKMQSVDQENIQMNSRYIDTSQTNGETSLANSHDSLTRTGADVEADVNNYVAFSNSVNSQLGLLSQIVPLLNVTATNSAGQISETAAGFVTQDSQLDSAARNATLAVVSSFESELDNRAQMVIASANGQIVPELVSR